MKKILPLALAAAMTTPAFAQSPFSAEVLLGNYSNKAEFGGQSGSSESSTGVGLRGVWTFHPNFAIEGAYQNFGEAKWQEIDAGDLLTEKVETSALTLGVKGVYPINERFSLHARIGLAFWDIDVEFTDSGFPQDNFSFSDDGNDVYFGLGGEYQINSNFYAGVAYNYLKADISVLGIASVDYTINGVQAYIGYRF